MKKQPMIHKRLADKPQWAAGWHGQYETRCGCDAEEKEITSRWSKVTCLQCLAMKKQPVIHKWHTWRWTRCGCNAVALGQTTTRWDKVTCKRCLATQAGKLIRHKITCKRCLATRKKKR